HAQVYVVPLGAGRMRGDVARLMPPLAMSLPHALKAARAGRRAGLWTTISGAPLCLLGPHHALALASAPRHHPSACAECGRRGSCPGVDASYLERFGDGELSAARAPTGPTDESTEDWRHAFAGVGPQLWL
ncbi:MAG: hypothetical protein GXP55_10105, partial [Deltaproteobacteria bacterium]|nr:hypothetical protein [Deltaproteobacteria bacterium]